MREEFLNGVRDRCQISFVRNLDTYIFVAIIPDYKVNNGWETRHADHTPPGWTIVKLCLRTSGNEVSSRLAALALIGLLIPELIIN